MRFILRKNITERSEYELTCILVDASKGCEKALRQLIDEYNSKVMKTIQQTLTKNKFHEVLSINYMSAAEELSSETWFKVHKKFKQGALFDAPVKFISYICIVARNTAKAYMKERIEKRKQNSHLQNLKKDLVEEDTCENLILDGRFEKTDGNKNLKFDRIDDLGDENLRQIPRASAEELVLEEMQALDVLNSLSDKEKEVLRLTIECETQEEVALKMGVSVRTIFNLIKGIENKS